MTADAPAPTSRPDAPPLDEVMLAMDVVDTLRHRQGLVERELSLEQRDAQLIEQLRGIYRGQGIEVSDHVLAEGVKALKEERFAYRPPPESFNVRLARWYVSRDRWLPPLVKVGSFAALLAIGYFLFVIRPAAARRAELPGLLEQQRQAVVELSVEPEPEETAARLARVGEEAIESGDTDQADQSLAELAQLRATLEREYELRIVSRPGERSGVIRTPDDSPEAENYYIVVEATAPDGSVLTLPIRSEEDGSTSNVKRWGVRVEREVFDRVRDDKTDDGIIQNNRFGKKRRGYPTPEYTFPTTGGSITSW